MPEPVPCIDELLLAVPVAVAPELLEDSVDPVDVEALLRPADPPLVPNTAMPVSSKRLCGGNGTVRDRLLPFAALEAVEAVLLALVDGIHDAAVPAASTVPTVCELAVPVVVPACATAPPAEVLADVTPVLTEVTVPLAEVTPVLAAVTPLPEVAEDVPVPLAEPADP